MQVGNQVVLLWVPVAGAVSYNVYRNDTREGVVTGSQYLGTTPAEAGTHRYQVAALDPEGVEGERSAPGLLKVANLSAPEGLSARQDPSSGVVGLVWSRSTGAAFYNVHRADRDEAPKLVASVKEPLFRDGPLERGVPYRYTVASVGMNGAEGPASAPATVVVERAPAGPAEPVRFQAAPATEEFSLDHIGAVRLDQVSFLGADDAGRVWVVTPKTGQLHCLDSSGTLLRSLGPYSRGTSGRRFVPHKLAFGPGGTLYATDALHALLACLDAEGNLLWDKQIRPPPPELDLWDRLPKPLRGLPATPSSLLLVGDELWVTDQRLHVVYRFDREGNPLGVFSSYSRDGREVRLPTVGEMAVLGENRFLLTFPFAHSAVVVDRAFRHVLSLGANANGYTGGFALIHGAQAVPGNRVLLTDPAVGSVQLFDAGTGRYLSHVTGPAGKNEVRGFLPVQIPNMALWALGGRIWVYAAERKQIVVFRLTNA